MKKYVIILFTLLCIFNSNAEGLTSRKSNPNYKYLKFYVRVLQHYEKSDFYLAQIDIVNTGNSSVSFWETTNAYSSIFVFSASGVWFINKYQREYYEKYKTDPPPQKIASRKVRIFPHAKYTIKTQFYIYNKERFLKTNKNLRVVFLYNEANLEFRKDDMVPKIISENTIDYMW